MSKNSSRKRSNSFRIERLNGREDFLDQIIRNSGRKTQYLFARKSVIQSRIGQKNRYLFKEQEGR
ncbi:hypothetical protein LEP1GSC036_1642 [Leptospira weilii str. 2006001853]|uniref:Uncharacterized protein n=1 Tax=Leptospira weilii str. 2006001853 TaxID=1001589 RepID=A0A828YUU4_9LEPT|nr:hypothetical protein LEP1GSC036_1642 [Leptospira weilii str. 2006001853]QDK22342.1 hypothetical protein FHG67_06065 [Leptospira weilii]QDK26285.1 hypothetical protein FHG68_05985 [Leptospira weilii]